MKTAHLLPLTLFLAASAAAQTIPDKPNPLDMTGRFMSGNFKVSQSLNSRAKLYRLQAGASRCYAIQSYRFQRERTDSDVTTFVSATTCQPANTVHFKTAESR